MKELHNFLPINELSKEKAERFNKIEQILEALDYLRKNMEDGDDEDIQNLLNSTFNICLVAYNTLLKAEFSDRITSVS